MTVRDDIATIIFRRIRIAFANLAQAAQVADELAAEILAALGMGGEVEE